MADKTPESVAAAGLAEADHMLDEVSGLQNRRHNVGSLRTMFVGCPTDQAPAKVATPVQQTVQHAKPNRSLPTPSL
jgi:hypothetical protein